MKIAFFLYKILVLFTFFQVYIDNRVAVTETFSAVVGAYDLDTNDELTLFKKISSNGSFILTPLNPKLKETLFDCNDTWVIL